MADQAGGAQALPGHAGRSHGGACVTSSGLMIRPTLVVFGVGDPYIPWEQAERQRESFPSARIELLDGLWHWPFLEDPARVSRGVIPFLRERVVGSAARSGTTEQS